MNESARLLGIARRARPKALMEPLRQAVLSVDSGLSGDCRGKPGRRQITVLSEMQWQQACVAIGRDLEWTTRRANLLINGIVFGPEDVGRVLVIGDARLRVSYECDPCHRMDAAAKGLRTALESDWRGGICCRVEQGAIIQVGDSVCWLDT
jgi:MOSC domain-containing protein YiiM